MKVSIIAIGNSRGVRLPKAVLEQVGLRDEADLRVEDGRIILTPPRAPRAGWAEAYAAASATLDDEETAWLDASVEDGGAW